MSLVITKLSLIYHCNLYICFKVTWDIVKVDNNISLTFKDNRIRKYKKYHTATTLYYMNIMLKSK
jgi:hypothetical protein